MCDAIDRGAHESEGCFDVARTIARCSAIAPAMFSWNESDLESTRDFDS